MSADQFNEPDFDGELPADFAELGAQLQADAQRLSGVYPACRPPTELIDALAARERRWWLRRELFTVGAKAALVVLVAGLIVAASVPWSRPTNPVEAKPATAADHSLVQNPVAASEVAAGEIAVQPVSYQPVAGFNGPELEGLLDLLQEQPQTAATSISF